MSVQVGQIIEGKVTNIMNYGVFVKIDDETIGLVHISEVSRDYVENINTILKTGDDVKVKILSINENGKIALSIKKALPLSEKNYNNEQKKSKSNNMMLVEDTPESRLDNMLSKFLKDSDEKQLCLKRTIESKRGYSKRR